MRSLHRLHPVSVGMGIIRPVSRQLLQGKPLLRRFRKPSAKHRVADMPIMGPAQALPHSRMPTVRIPLPAASAEALIIGISPSEKTIKVKTTDSRKRRSGCVPIDKN